MREAANRLAAFVLTLVDGGNVVAMPAREPVAV